MKLYYEESGAGEAVLLLHGFTGFSGDWKPLLAELPDHFCYVIPDLPGHGQSPTAGDVYTHREAAKAVYQLLDRLGIERFTACGMSGGAMTLLHMATEQPSRVEGMILVSATTHYTDQTRAIMAAVTPENMPVEEWQAMRKKHSQGDEQIRKLWVYSNAFKDDVDDMNFQPKDLEEITARTLLIHGDSDPLIPVEVVETMHDSIPDALLWMIPAGGHVPVFGEEMPEFLRRTSQFLNKEFKPDRNTDQ
ncbi:MAG: alpha/beta hydrolase [Verrucomicrobiota bacterium]